MQTMQIILQNFLSFEDAYEKAQLKNQKMKKQECFFVANIIFALFDQLSLSTNKINIFL